MLVDAHAHLDRYDDAHLAEAIAQIERHGIVTLSVTMDVESYLKTKALAGRSTYIRPAFGVHPWEAARYADRLDELEAYLRETPIIGEAGLDRRFVRDETQYGPQRRVFERQCEWAARLGKPMNLHTAGAERDVLDVLRACGVTGCIAHWYAGPRDLIDEYLALGCFFTVGVEVLTSPAIRDIARLIPDDRLLLETDNPGAYRWLNGETGMPVVLLDVLAEVAGLRGVEPGELESRIAENWRALVKVSAAE